jgi:hypothetical protein
MAMGACLTSLLLALCLAACSSTPSGPDPDGSSPREPEPEPIVDERCVEILTAMAKTLREAKRFSVEAETTVEEFLSTGHAVELETAVKASIRRPDGVFVEKVTERHERRLFYDGKRVTLLDVGENLFAAKDFTGSLGELVDGLEARFGITMPLADLIVMDADLALSEFADWGTYLGIHRVRGRSCHHMVFANDVIEWQVWIQSEGVPLPRKLVILYKDEPDRPRFSATITRWDLAAEFADDVFTFAPPDGAVEIDLEEVSPADEKEGDGK